LLTRALLHPWEASFREKMQLLWTGKNVRLMCEVADETTLAQIAPDMARLGYRQMAQQQVTEGEAEAVTRRIRLIFGAESPDADRTAPRTPNQTSDVIKRLATVGEVIGQVETSTGHQYQCLVPITRFAAFADLLERENGRLESIEISAMPPAQAKASFTLKSGPVPGMLHAEMGWASPAGTPKIAAVNGLTLAYDQDSIKVTGTTLESRLIFVPLLQRIKAIPGIREINFTVGKFFDAPAGRVMRFELSGTLNSGQ